MTYEKQPGVPRFEAQEYGAKSKDFVLLIPIINEGNRIHQELRRAQEHHVADHVDIVICDGGSQDGSTAEEALKALDVNTLLVKQDEGRLSRGDYHRWQQQGQHRGCAPVYREAS